MIHFENTVEIARDPRIVYTYLADLEHTPEWNWAITSTRKVTPGPVAVGTRYRQTREVPRPAVELVELTRLVPDRTVEVEGPIGAFRARVRYELEPTAHGTRLTNVVELDPPVPIGPLSGLVGGRIRSSVAKNLVVLKGLLEGSGR
jgi:Polyketide cyclase / dehydrase and lipid transport